MDTPANAVVAEGICRRYGPRWALIDVSFRVARGTTLMVAGRNGSGKTTLFRVLSTVIRADRGSGSIEGHPLVHREEVRRHIALLSHAANTYEALTALENLDVAASFLRAVHDRDYLMSILDRVGLADRADDSIHTFSAGMRKRLSIARVLLQVDAGHASVVLLDEPYGQLDPPGFRFVEQLFATLRERGVTVLLSTHQLARGSEICEEGLVLQSGRVYWMGPARDLPRLSGLEGVSS